MSIQVPVTKDELKKIQRQLRSGIDLICMDQIAYIKTLLAARDMLMHGKDVKAKIVKGF